MKIYKHANTSSITHKTFEIYKIHVESLLFPLTTSHNHEQKKNKADTKKYRTLNAKKPRQKTRKHCKKGLPHNGTRARESANLTLAKSASILERIAAAAMILKIARAQQSMAALQRVGSHSRERDFLRFVSRSLRSAPHQKTDRVFICLRT